MDYPKSVAGVGLVDGQFVDEDQVSGTPGSLIPAQWGNDVTEEILNVVREVGDEPAEADRGQLVGAIWKMFRAATAGSTELFRGVLRVGTQAEVDAGVLDDVAVTPKKLRMGFAISLGQNSYIVFPTWLGGLVIQFGVTAESGVLTTWPIEFPTACRAAALLSNSSATTSTYEALGQAGAAFNFQSSTTGANQVGATGIYIVFGH